MSDTRVIPMTGYETYVALSLDNAANFSATNDGSREARIMRTDANGAPDASANPGRPLPPGHVVERQADGYYWVRGVGRMIIDDLG